MKYLFWNAFYATKFYLQFVLKIDLWLAAACLVSLGGRLRRAL